LVEADLSEGNLEFAGMFRTNLQEAILDRANLYGADVRGANVAKASFRGTKLQGVAIRYAHGFSQEQLNEACVDVRTRLPQGMKTPVPCQLK
jgi:uncharacterized protein YjbI with pentapeptide repeats